MLKLLKNLKNSFWSVLVIIIFLVIQSQTDLALPEYTSKIVNVGIQSGGIEDPIPRVMSQEDMELLELFAQDEEQYLQIKNSYKKINDEELTKKEQKTAKNILGDDYQEIDGYVLKDLTDEEKEDLSGKIATPILELSTIKNEEIANKIKEQIIANVPQGIQDSYKQQLNNLSLVEILKQMPNEQLNKLLEEYNKQLSGLEDSMKEQAAISGVKTIYQDLNIDTDKIQNDYILNTGLQMLGIASITMISAVTVMLLSARVAAKLGRTLREKVFKKVLSFSNKEFREFSTASLITRSTNDIQQIQQLIAILFRVVVYAPIIAIGGFTKILTSTDNSLAWIIGVEILAILFVIGTLFIIVMPKFTKLQTLVDKMNGVSREILTGLQVIRAFNKEKREEKRFDDANKDLMKANIFVNRAMSLMMPL